MNYSVTDVSLENLSSLFSDSKQKLNWSSVFITPAWLQTWWQVFGAGQNLNDLCKRGVIRRFGATLRHQKTGFTANAMVAWQVKEDRIEEVGEKMASFHQVSHCYRRDPTDTWPYNLYTMIHANDEQSCRQTARKLAETASIDDYTLLFSQEELKKTSMVYFPSDEDD